MEKTPWDRGGKYKLLVRVGETRSVRPKSGYVFKSMSVRLSLGKSKCKTRSFKNCTSADFDDLCCFQFENTAILERGLEVEMIDGSSSVGGFRVVDDLCQVEDIVMDKWYDVVYVHKKAKLDEPNGELHLRLYITSAEEHYTSKKSIDHLSLHDHQQDKQNLRNAIIGGPAYCCKGAADKSSWLFETEDRSETWSENSTEDRRSDDNDDGNDSGRR